MLTMLFRFMLLSKTAFQEKCLFLLLISFGATKLFLTRIKSYRYGPVTMAIVGEGAFSRIIPQGILEIILFLGGTVCPLENMNLFGVLDLVEQPVKIK